MDDLNDAISAKSKVIAEIVADEITKNMKLSSFQKNELGIAKGEVKERLAIAGHMVNEVSVEKGGEVEEWRSGEGLRRNYTLSYTPIEAVKEVIAALKSPGFNSDGTITQTFGKAFLSMLETSIKDEEGGGGSERGSYMSTERAGGVFEKALNHFINGKELEATDMPMKEDKIIIDAVKDIVEAFDTISASVAKVLTCCGDTENCQVFRDAIIVILQGILNRVPTVGDLLNNSRK